MFVWYLFVIAKNIAIFQVYQPVVEFYTNTDVSQILIHFNMLLGIVNFTILLILKRHRTINKGITYTSLELMCDYICFNL